VFCSECDKTQQSERQRRRRRREPPSGEPARLSPVSFPFLALFSLLALPGSSLAQAASITPAATDRIHISLSVTLSVPENLIEKAAGKGVDQNLIAYRPAEANFTRTLYADLKAAVLKR
jgi:hypothetical protein